MDRHCIICGEVPNTAFTYPRNMKEAFKWQSLLGVYLPAETLRRHCCICQKHVDLSVTQQRKQQQQTQSNRCSGGHMAKTYSDINDQRLSVSFKNSNSIHYLRQHNDLDENDNAYSKHIQKSNRYSQYPSTPQNKECGFDSCTSGTTTESDENVVTSRTSGYEKSAAKSNDSTTYTCGPCCSQRENQMTGKRTSEVNGNTFSQQGSSRKDLVPKHNGLQETRQPHWPQRLLYPKCNLSTYKKNVYNNISNQMKKTVTCCNSCCGYADKAMQQGGLQNANPARRASKVPLIDNSSNPDLANKSHQTHLQNQEQKSQMSQKCQFTDIKQSINFKSSSPSDDGCLLCPVAADKIMPEREFSNFPSADNKQQRPVNVLVMGGSMLPTYCNTSTAKDKAPLVPEMFVLESDFTKERAVFPDIDEPKYTVCRPLTEPDNADITCQSKEGDGSSMDVLLLSMAQSEPSSRGGNAGIKWPSQETNQPLLADQNNEQAKDVNLQKMMQYQKTHIDELGSLLTQQEKLQQSMLAKLNELQVNLRGIDINGAGKSAKPTATVPKTNGTKTIPQIPRANAGIAESPGAFTLNSTHLYAMPGTSKPQTATDLHNQVVSDQLRLGSMKGGQGWLLPKQICINPMIRILPTIASYKAN